MTMQSIKKKRVRITQKEIEGARQELAQAKESPPTRPKAEREISKWGKDFWFGLVYCDSYGHAWIDNFKSVYLGKTEEVIPYLKKRGIDGGNVGMVLQAAKEFQSEKESQSYHLAMKDDVIPISIPSAKPNRITFKDDPPFLASLDELIAKGYGIPTIQKELKAKGYDVAYATLGRWVKKHRDSQEAIRR